MIELRISKSVVHELRLLLALPALRGFVLPDDVFNANHNKFGLADVPFELGFFFGCRCDRLCDALA